MASSALHESTRVKFREVFAREPDVLAFAPGRIEVLGNHTDYNEGYVLSAAIDMGILFAAARRPGTECRLHGGRVDELATFDVRAPRKGAPGWANYIIGVCAGISSHGDVDAFDALVMGDIPIGSGLSSSAALEMATGVGLAALFGITVSPLDLARIGQRAEHEFAGVRCGLLDQVSSMFGRSEHLVLTDFRSLDVETLPLGPTVSFVLCNTRVKHSLVDSAYNERRAMCEAAAQFFHEKLHHPVQALRDVSWEEWMRYEPEMDPVLARRAAHVVGENTRALKARPMLEKGDLAGFGQLMYDSHESSRRNFENSCAELDAIVDSAQSTPGVLGARLSGGGWGGSALLLVEAAATDAACRHVAASYNQTFGHPCETRIVHPADGARRV